MVTIVTRAGKGAPLTNNEVDANFTNTKVAVEAVEANYATQVYTKKVAKKAAIKFGG